MARLLVYGRNKAEATNAKMGDIVVSRPDDHVWGDKEVFPTWWQIDIPGDDPLFWESTYCNPRFQSVPVPNGEPGETREVVTKFREYSIAFNKLPREIRDQLDDRNPTATGKVTTTRAIIEQAMGQDPTPV